MASRGHSQGFSFHVEGAHSFPTPERVAALDPDELAARIRAGYRASYLHELATAIAEGRLAVEAWGHSDRPSDDLYRPRTPPPRSLHSASLRSG